MTTTVIRNADWIVAWDGSTESHVYQRDGDLAFKDDHIIQVGGRHSGPAEVEIEGAGLCLMPGLVNIHSHPYGEMTYRGLREEHGVPEQFMSGLYERACAFRADPKYTPAIAEAAYCELVLSGCTTLADLSSPYDGWIEVMARSGMRMFAAPAFSARSWRLEDKHQLLLDEDPERGVETFEVARAMMDTLAAHPSGRLSGIVFPAQIETCPEDLLRDSIAFALEKNLPWTTHISQSVTEFQLMVRMTGGKTPVQWAAELGLLTPNSILGHAIFIDEHSWLHWSTRDDIRLIAESGTTVAHCPTPFSRYGQTLENFGKYQAAGINMGIGTDTIPQNMIEEMRTAAILARISAHDISAGLTADVFHAATAGGAKALMRDDIGRLAVGAKADIVLVDLTHPLMQPVRDPLRSLVYSAADRAVRDVYIDGALVVKDRVVLTMDQQGSLRQVREAQIAMEASAPTKDYAGRTAEQIAPLSLPVSG